MDVTGDQLDAFPEMMSKLYKPKKKKGITVPSEKDDPFYKMDHPKRGLAIIFNHEKFTLASLKPRNGTEADCANLKNTLVLLGFEVIVHHDLTYKELDSVVEEVSNYNFIDCDCLLIAVLSHGEQNIIYAKNMAYSTNILFERFTPDRCPTLAGKPKLYVIQACQGDKLDCGVDVEVDNGVQSYRIPLHADFLIAYSTIPGYYSWRNTQRGSWFIQALCEEVNKHWKDYDFMTILTFINRRVAYDFESNVPMTPTMHKQKQIPCITSMLTRLVKFSVKNEVCNGIQSQ
jgi:caspase-like apoptosis-related cysteine protease